MWFFRTVLTKYCAAEEINVQKNRLESTLRIFVLLITIQGQNIVAFYYHCMLWCHIKTETRLTVLGFFYKQVAYYEFVHHGSCSLTSKRDTQQQKHGFTEKPEQNLGTFYDLGFQVFSKTRSSPAASLTFLQYKHMNALFEAPVYTLWASGTTEMPCKTQQQAWNTLSTVKAGSAAAAQSTVYVIWQLYHLPDPLCVDEQK